MLYPLISGLVILFCFLSTPTFGGDDSRFRLEEIKEGIQKGESSLWIHNSWNKVLKWKSKTADGEILAIENDQEHLPNGSEKPVSQTFRFTNYSLKKKVFEKVWSETVWADQYNLFEDQGILSTTLMGCCGNSNAHRLYSLKSGTFLMPYSLPDKKQPLKVRFKNHSYFVGYHDSYWPVQDALYYAPEKEDIWQLYGLLTLSDSERIIQQLAVYRKKLNDPPNEPFSMKMDYRKHLILTWKLAETQSINIPLSENGFQISDAKIDSDYKIETVASSDFHDMKKLNTKNKRQNKK